MSTDAGHETTRAIDGGDWHDRFAAALAELNRQWPAILARLECAQPRPLPVNGREYARRQANRRKRR